MTETEFQAKYKLDRNSGVQVLQMEVPFKGSNYQICDDSVILVGKFRKPEISKESISLLGFLSTDISAYKYDWGTKSKQKFDLDLGKPVCLIFYRETGSGDYVRDVEEFELLKHVFEFVAREGEYLNIEALPMASSEYGEFRKSVLKLHPDPDLCDPVGDWDRLRKVPPARTLSSGKVVQVPARVVLTALEDEDESVTKLSVLSAPTGSSSKSNWGNNSESTAARLDARLQWLSNNFDAVKKMYDEKFSGIISIDKFFEMISR